MKEKIKVAVIGCGNIANNAHIPAYMDSANAEIKYFCDIIPERADKAVAKYGCGKAVYDYYDGLWYDVRFELDTEKNELTFKLQEVLTGYTAPETVPLDEQPTEEKNDLAELLKGVLGVTDSESSEDGAPALDIYNEQYADEPSNEAEEVVEPDDAGEEIASYDSNETEEDAAVLTEEASFETEKEEIPKEDTYEADLLKIREEQLRRQIEAEIREKIALEAKVKAEEEALQLRRAHDELKAENERLVEIARRAEEERLASEAERAAEAEKLRLEIEARERAEAREKERIAEAARLAVLEHQRLEAERAEEERRRREEEERIREERARLEEEAKAAEARRIEEERIRAEMAVRAAEAAAKEASIAKESEDAAIEAAAIEAKAALNKAAPSYNYTSKNARLLFRRPVDPNITKRIHEIILTTVKYFHKENVYIRVKATVPDSTTVNLHFVKIPEEETELLVNIIKVLGKSDLGITKVFLE